METSLQAVHARKLCDLFGYIKTFLLPAGRTNYYSPCGDESVLNVT
jgi:hypothetical protein